MKEAVKLILGGLGATVFGTLLLIQRLQKVKEINWSSDDDFIKATVVDWHYIYAGDVQPVVSYWVDGEEKKYEYIYFYNRKDFPIGKEIYLKFSKRSGLAYDKKDLIKGLLWMIFGILFFGMGVILGIIAVFLNIL